MVPSDIVKHYLNNPGRNMDVATFRPVIAKNPDGNQTWSLQMLDFGEEVVRTHVFENYAEYVLTACFFKEKCGIYQTPN
jgi:hypothetical protein